MSAAATYRETYRPQYHFTPPVNWMNDPNGLVYLDGEWHLFYQYNPFGITWGHMSWGHAVSTDLVHWRHLPVAIPEQGDEMVFSGSAVVDWRNTSGFGHNGEAPLVSIWTAHNERRKHQAQALAYSTDKGRTWTRYAANPVLDLNKSDFRDPKVFWHAPSNQWVMVVVVSPEHRVQLYGSRNLKEWTHLSDFGPAGAVAGIWECPDLFPLPVDGDSTRTRWVLIVNLNPGSVAGGSGTQYFVGEFDGRTFTPDPANGTAPLWLDYGRDNYAGVTFSDVPPGDGRRVLIGWMNNWDYAQKIPTTPWRSATTVPRVLSLRTTTQGIRLVQQPVQELSTLRGAARTLSARTIGEGTQSLGASGISGAAYELDVEFEPGTAQRFGVHVRVGNGEFTTVGVDMRTRSVFIDRRHSGDTTFHAGFAGVQSAPLIQRDDGSVRLRLFVDWSSVELFAGAGESVITDQIFPSPGSTGVSLFVEGGAAVLRRLSWWPLATSMSAVTGR